MSCDDWEGVLHSVYDNLGTFGLCNFNLTLINILLTVDTGRASHERNSLASNGVTCSILQDENLLEQKRVNYYFGRNSILHNLNEVP